MEISSFEEISVFAREHFRRIFNIDHNSEFIHDEDTHLKELYYRETADIFCYRHENKIVGVTLMAPSDWNSYYIRHHSVLEEQRGWGITQGFLEEVLLPQLTRLGVKRVQAETSPENFAIITILTRLGFNITGTMNSERWASTLYFTKFLAPRNKSVFLKQFCFGNTPQSKESR